MSNVPRWGSPGEEPKVFDVVDFDWRSGWSEVWLCPRPEDGARYQVLSESWRHADHEIPVRTIHEIRIVSD